MTRKEYNGWYNYETWLFNIHWDNHFTTDAEDAWAFAEACKIFTREERAALDLADRIKEIAEEFTQETLGNGTNPWIADLVNASFSEINFHEIAQHYIADLDTAEGE
jgi:hypothetical protein